MLQHSLAALRTSARSLTGARTFVSTARVNTSAGEAKIMDILTKRFAPAMLKVQDVSGGCGSFYAIEMSSKEFNGLSLIKSHRLVNEELKNVIKDIHGLQLKTLPEE